MFLEVKGFEDILIINSFKIDEKGEAEAREGQNIKFALYYTNDDEYPIAEFQVDREAFESEVGGNVELRDRFTINPKIRRSY